MKTIFLSIIIILTSIPSIIAQSDTTLNIRRQLRELQSNYADTLIAYEDSINSFRCNSNDLLYWNEKEYSLSHSPLTIFEDYKEWFQLNGGADVFTLENVSYKTYDEKSYLCQWIIIEDKLLLRETHYIFPPEAYPELPTLTKLAILTKSKCTHKWDHKITGETIVKYFSFYHPNGFKEKSKAISPSPEGVIFAKWFTGTFDIIPHAPFDAIAERFYRATKNEEDPFLIEKERFRSNIEKANLPYIRLTFRKGKLVKQETMTPKKIK